MPKESLQFEASQGAAGPRGKLFFHDGLNGKQSLRFSTRDSDKKTWPRRLGISHEVETQISSVAAAHFMDGPNYLKAALYSAGGVFAGAVLGAVLGGGEPRRRDILVPIMGFLGATGTGYWGLTRSRTHALEVETAGGSKFSWTFQKALTEDEKRQMMRAML
ncbi:MAG: hypothetical protein MHM6MM_000273 [Cercozoa sp. M6MM]